MKIYIQDKGQALGPFSEEEVRHKIYSGEFPRECLACPEGGQDWAPLETVLRQGAVALPTITSPAVSLEKLRDPKEKTALVWLYIASVFGWIILLALIVTTVGILLAIILLGFLIRAFGEMMFVAYLKSNAVRVSPTQLPEVFAIVQSSCARLNLAAPEVYVMQQNVWNSFAAKVFGRRMVVLLSGAVDSILLKGDLQELSWLVGHELGHHWAGHFKFSRKLASLGDWCIWVALWRSRRGEFTCDRVGLYCAGSLKASQRAIVNATVGAQLAGKVSVEEAINQWRQHSGEFFVRYRALYSTHPHLLARLDYLSSAAQEFGIRS
jgi:Zn-dependent protease with chaperone function